VSPASPLYAESLAEQLSYSSQAVAEALTEAGWTRGDSGWVTGRQKLQLELVASTENADRAAAAQHLVSGLNAMASAPPSPSSSGTAISPPWKRGTLTFIWGRCGSPPTLICPPSSPPAGP